MSLFEKIKNKRYGLQEENKKKKFQKPSDPWFSGPSKNVNPTDSKEISSRLSASTTRGDQARSQYNPDGGYGDSDVGDQQTTKGRNNKKFSKNIPSTTTVGGKNKPSDASEFTKRVNRANKNRKEFIKGRKTYTDSKTGIEPGKPTKEGIKKYISKARNMSQGTNANVKANKKAAEVIAQSASKEYADKIAKKYETDKRMIKTRKPRKTVAQLKKEIDSRPIDGRTIKKISKPEVQKLTPNRKFTQNLGGKLSQTKLGNPSSLAKTSRHLLKHKNKYAVGAGLALAGGAYLLGKTRLKTADKNQKKALLLAKQKKAKEPKKMVDVSLFLNKTGTPPTKTSKPKFNSVYDKNYIKNLKSKK